MTWFADQTHRYQDDSQKNTMKAASISGAPRLIAAILSLALLILSVQAATSENAAATFGSTDGSSITLNPGYRLSDITTVSESLPTKKYASLNGPIFGEDRAQRKFVQGQVSVLTYPGVSLLEEWKASQRPDPEEIILDEATREKESILANNSKLGYKTGEVSEDWIEFLGRKTRLVAVVTTMPNGTKLYLRVIVFRARDSFYTVKCLSLGRIPNGWASATIHSISDGK